MKLTITDEFQQALNIMQNSWSHLFISGKAGTGKSTLLKLFLKQSTRKKHAVVAPTGIAAMNVNGATIHSFFKFPPLYLRDIPKLYRKNPTRKVLQHLEMLIIDEISMVRVDLLDAIDRSLRQNRGSNLPFGGIQMMFIGDLHQLPPVVPEKHGIKEKIYDQFSGEFFFDAPVMKKIQYKFISLETVFRQNENESKFKEALNKIREGKHTNEHLHLINQKVPPFTKKLGKFKKITSQSVKFLTSGKIDLKKKWGKIEESKIMKISPLNEQVFRINKEKYDKLKSKEFIFFRSRRCSSPS